MQSIEACIVNDRVIHAEAGLPLVALCSFAAQRSVTPRFICPTCSLRMMRLALLLAIVLLSATSVRSEEAVVPKLAAGDIVRVTAESTSLYLDEKVVAEIKQGTTFQAARIAGKWIAGYVPMGEARLPGWIGRSDVQRIAVLSGNDSITVLTGVGAELDAEVVEDVTQLDASGLHFGDAELRHVARLKNLRTLYLDDTEITDAGMGHLKGLTELDVLALHGTNINGEGLANLSALPKLRVLNLSNCPITDDSLAHIKGLTSLETLAFRDTKITDRGFAHLAGLTKMIVMNIDRCRITGASLKHLARMDKLRIVRARGVGLDKESMSAANKVSPQLAIFP
jgi:hypothetical protein